MEFRPDIVKQVGWLIGLTLLLGVSACSGLIKVVPLATPMSVQASTDGLPVSEREGPSRIMAEAIGLDAPVVEMGWRSEQKGGQIVSVWEVPYDEAGWHRNSAQPGQTSNVVISGHNKSLGGHVFGHLEEIEVGDRVTLWTDEGTSYVYQVSEKQIVRAFGASPEALDYLRTVIQPTTREQLTLITCWPSWTNTHRLIVIAHPM